MDSQKSCQKAKREQEIGDLLERCTEILQQKFDADVRLFDCGGADLWRTTFRVSDDVARLDDVSSKY